ncbi:MAG: glycosyltransferase family 4 protein [Patescibacteria group bacterium]
MGYLFYVIIFGIRSALYARRVSADVVYTRDPVTFFLCSIAGVRPLAWEVHTAHSGVPRAIIQRALGIVPITRGLAKWYELRGVPADSLHVAPDAVDLQSFSKVDPEIARADLRSRLAIPADGKIALYVGSFGLYAWKGVDVARKAAEGAPEITWLFVGGSSEECTALSRDTSPNVRTLPRVQRKDIPSLLSAADVLLLPNKSGDSASERDTSPMKLFEYMGSSVPIVASDIPSLREILDERTAFLVHPNEPEALAAGVRRALHNPAEASRRASAARTAAESYTWDVRAKNLLAFLERRIRQFT